MAKSRTNSKINNKTTIIVVACVIFVAVLAAGAYFVFAQPKTDDWQPQSNDQASETTTQTPSQPGEAPVAAKGSYQIYEPSKLALANNGQVVLFFNAKWCPDCQTANKNFQKEQIPDGLTILSVDYDKYTDLKKKYGVTYQHTFVQVDANGNQIKKWPASYTVAEVEKQVQK